MGASWRVPALGTAQLWDMEHSWALIQGGMVWRTPLASLQVCLPPVLGSSDPIWDGLEGNWFQFATHPSAPDPFPWGKVGFPELGRWDIPKNPSRTAKPNLPLLCHEHTEHGGGGIPKSQV